ncbi:MAG: hypothetical protein JWO43_301 [Candidatus Adlerbacteria bacterium]|nr:hypothetical protein [Candidatus Adlerbacteria bacterium]
MAILVLYFMQQLGVMLGLGSQIILLVTFLMGKRDGIINSTEDKIAHSIYRVLILSLILIVLSGAAITVLHFLTNEGDVIIEPAFLMKWQLIATAIATAVLIRGSAIWNEHMEGVAGANWGALFLVHIFAPVTSYLNLVILYIEWMLGFIVIWELFVFMLRPDIAVQFTEPAKEKNVPAVPAEKPLFAARPKPLPLNAIRIPARPPISRVETPVSVAPVVVAVPEHPKPKPVTEVPVVLRTAVVTPPLERPEGSPPPAPVAILNSTLPQATVTSAPPPPGSSAEGAFTDPERGDLPALRVMPQNKEELDEHLGIIKQA